MSLLARLLVALILLWGTPAAATQLFITSTSTFSLPGDWPGIADKVECLGPGGTGSARNSTTRGGSGGGGGEYAAETNVVVTSPVSATVGAGGSGTATSFPGDSVTITCHAGGTGTTTAGGAGGTGSINTTHSNGGAGRTTPTSTASGGGGGGAAGPTGTGTTAASNVGGAADGGTVSAPAAGNVGNSGTEWDGTHGSGTGASGFASGSNVGPAGGTYGGGGAGHADGSTGAGGVGGAGLIIINYTPGPTASHIQSFIIDGTIASTPFTTTAFTAIGSGDAIVGLVSFNPPVALSSVTDNASGNTYTIQSTAAYDSYGTSFSLFTGINIQGGPTTLTLTFTGGTPSASTVQFDEYSGVGSVDTSFNVWDNTNTTAVTHSLTSTISGDTIWGNMQSDGGTVTTGSNYTRRINDTVASGSDTEDRIQASAGAIAITWTRGTSSVNGQVVMGVALAPPSAATCSHSFALVGVGC